MKNKTKKIATLFAFLALLLITSGVTVAFFTYIKQGSTVNTITSGGITFHYKELKGIGHGISIVDALPTDNETARTSDKYFDFKITSTTTGGVTIPYVVTARMSSDSDSILGNIVNIYLTEVNGNSETPTDLFDDVDGESKPIYVKYNSLSNYNNLANEKIIYTDTVNTSNYEKDFKLRMWIDGGVNLNTGDGTSDYNNKKFSITVNVNAGDSLASIGGNGGTDPNDPNNPNNPNTPDPANQDDNIPDLSFNNAGLYTDTGSNDALIESWEDLISNNYLAVNDGVLTYGSNRSGLQALEGKLVIDESVTSINTYTFSGTKITTVEMPDTVTEIKNGAFQNANTLRNIRLSKNLTSIGYRAFYKTTNLGDVIIPSSVTTMGEQAFYQSGLTSVNISTGLEAIPGEAFYECRNLASVIISRGIEGIGSSAFNGCTSLTSIDIPSSVKTISSSAFSNNSALATVTLHNGLETLSNSVFQACTSLETIVIPNSVTSMGDFVFGNCTSLENVTLPNTLTTISRQMFDHCTSLESITLPESVTEIKNKAFQYCTNLRTINIPNSVTKMEFEVFEQCPNIEGTTSSDGFYYAGNSTNPYMVLLRKTSDDVSTININSNTKYISYGAFNNIRNVDTVTVPDGVKGIDTNAFNSTDVATIYLPASLIQAGNGAFTNGASGRKIYFADTSNWYTDGGTTPVDSADLAPETAATYLFSRAIIKINP